MPTLSLYRRALKFLDRMLVKLTYTPHSKRTRRHIAFISLLRRDLASKRYWERPQTYRAVHYRRSIDPLLSSSPNEFRFLFRMTRTEFDRLLRRFGGDDVFKSTGKRPQAPPMYQLALFIHRLAHGYELKAEARLFGVSGTPNFPSLPFPSVCPS